MVDNEDFLHLLHDLLLDAVVYDLQVLLLDLDYLLLLVESVEAVDEVEGAVVAVKAVDDRIELDLTLGGAWQRLGDVDGLCGCGWSVMILQYFEAPFRHRVIECLPARPAASAIVAMALKDMLVL